jgi:hypothetical protein
MIMATRVHYDKCNNAESYLNLSDLARLIKNEILGDQHFSSR